MCDKWENFGYRKELCDVFGSFMEIYLIEVEFLLESYNGVNLLTFVCFIAKMANSNRI